MFICSLRRQNEDLRAKLSMFEGSNVVPNEVVEAEASKLKAMHEKECRELRLTIKSLVRPNRITLRVALPQCLFVLKCKITDLGFTSLKFLIFIVFAINSGFLWHVLSLNVNNF